VQLPFQCEKRGKKEKKGDAFHRGEIVSVLEAVKEELEAWSVR
jgi:hypothetical protein